METQNKIQVLEAAYIGYPVVNVLRAQAFYESTFQLKRSMVFEENEKSWIEYTLPDGVTFAISNISDQWLPASGGPSLAFEVADFDAAIAQLKAQNVTFTVEPFETPVCWMAFILDTEGNSVGLHKRKLNPCKSEKG